MKLSLTHSLYAIGTALTLSAQITTELFFFLPILADPPQPLIAAFGSD